MDLLRDRMYPVTRRSNVSECDVTFEQYCNMLRSVSMYMHTQDGQLKLVRQLHFQT